jgi:hypothetical protein
MTENKSIEDKLNRLPLRALLAIASRCARRVQPLTRSLSKTEREAVERAIASAEALSVGDHDHFSSAIFSLEIGTAATAAVAATAAAAAVAVADAVFVAIESYASSNTSGAAAYAALSAIDASASAVLSFRDSDVAYAAAFADLDHLLAMNLGEPGTLGQPIDPTESGPLGKLWPEGEPEWYRNLVVSINAEGTLETNAESVIESIAPEGLVLQAYVGEFANVDEVSDALAKLGYALNAFHVEAGGNGLVIDDWKIYVAAPELAEVD